MTARVTGLLALLAAIATGCVAPVRSIGTTVKEIRADGTMLVLTRCELLLRGHSLVLEDCAEKWVSLPPPRACAPANAVPEPPRAPATPPAAPPAAGADPHD